MRETKANKGNTVLNAVAAIAKRAAVSDAQAACFVFVHQPKQPKDMYERLMKKEN